MAAKKPHTPNYDPHTPTYDLEELKELISNPWTIHITDRAWEDAVNLGFASENDIVREVLKLQRKNFKHTMPSEKKPGEFQDVYELPWQGEDLYIKLRKSPMGEGVIISFH